MVRYNPMDGTTAPEHWMGHTQCVRLYQDIFQVSLPKRRSPTRPVSFSAGRHRPSWFDICTLPPGHERVGRSWHRIFCCICGGIDSGRDPSWRGSPSHHSYGLQSRGCSQFHSSPDGYTPARQCDQPVRLDPSQGTRCQSQQDCHL